MSSASSLVAPSGNRVFQRLDAGRVIPISVRNVEQANTLLLFTGRKCHPKAQISLAMVMLGTRHGLHPITNSCPNDPIKPNGRVGLAARVERGPAQIGRELLHGLLKFVVTGPCLL